MNLVNHSGDTPFSIASRNLDDKMLGILSKYNTNAQTKLNKKQILASTKVILALFSGAFELAIYVKIMGETLPLIIHTDSISVVAVE
jgi:hypothetical protein